MPDTSTLKLTRSNFGTLLEPGQQKIFFDNYDENALQYDKVFTVEQSDKKQEQITHIGGFGLWEENAEGADINTDSATQGQTATFTNKRFDKGYSVSWELIQDDMYGVLHGITGKNGNAKNMGRSLHATVETEAANVLNNAFTTNGYDGVPLFSDEHPRISGTEEDGNVIAGALTDENLKEACKMLRTQKDVAGSTVIAAIPSQLIVHPDNEFVARTIVYSKNTSGGALNDINSLPNLDVVVMDYLTDEDAWFVKAKNVDNLMFFWREKPIFGSQQLPQTMDYFYYGYARFCAGYADWRGLVGGNVAV
ncbi:MAG: Mu-like prophage major head subunit gpT family protein [Clostridiales bacterium]|nr:Mu-like prophage major head subunit gpT family protein [Clostridiales bacterium]